MRAVVRDLVGVRRDYFDFQLDEREFAAIGRVTVQWAHLEHLIFSHSAGIANVVSVDIPKDALSTSFSRRLSAFRLLIEAHAPAEEKKRMMKIISKIANAEQDRHKLTHGLWELNPQNPDKITASSFRPNYEFEKGFDAEKIEELAKRIGEISFQMSYPEGYDEFLQERFSEPFFAISRTGRRALLGKPDAAKNDIFVDINITPADDNHT